MDNPLVDLYVVLIQASDKVRLLRSLNREVNPNVDEIVRRYTTDKKDFEEFSKLYEPEYILDTEGIPSLEFIRAAQEVVMFARRHWAE